MGHIQKRIGHIQKRIGNKLLKKKKTEKGLGKLGLVSAVIDKLQNYYGMAIRSNVGNIIETKKDIYAAWCHVCSSEKNNFHVHCPKGPKRWYNIYIIAHIFIFPLLKDTLILKC